MATHLPKTTRAHINAGHRVEVHILEENIREVWRDSAYGDIRTRRGPSVRHRLRFYCVKCYGELKGDTEIIDALSD